MKACSSEHIVAYIFLVTALLPSTTEHLQGLGRSANFDI